MLVYILVLEVRVMALKLCTIRIMPPYFWPIRAEKFFVRGG